MTTEEIAVLGHAFFDGKTLQYWDTRKWVDWTGAYCPNTSYYQLRIKPDEPKTITICTFVNVDGGVWRSVKGSTMWRNCTEGESWTHIKSLDQVVEVE